MSNFGGVLFFFLGGFGDLVRDYTYTPVNQHTYAKNHHFDFRWYFTSKDGNFPIAM